METYPGCDIEVHGDTEGADKAPVLAFLDLVILDAISDVLAKGVTLVGELLIDVRTACGKQTKIKPALL